MKVHFHTLVEVTERLSQYLTLFDLLQHKILKHTHFNFVRIQPYEKFELTRRRRVMLAHINRQLTLQAPPFTYPITNISHNKHCTLQTSHIVCYENESHDTVNLAAPIPVNLKL